MKICAVIPAAGFGKRMGGSVPKQFLLLDGKPVLAHTLAVFDQCAEIDSITLVAPEAELEEARGEWMNSWPKIRQVVKGGKERQDSVYNGLQSLDADAEIVVVHDGVRPFLTSDMLCESIDAARETGAAVVAIPANDTLKRVSEDGWIRDTVDRSGLWRVQTPQTFQVPLLKKAFEKAKLDGFYGTDESMLVERMGGAVKIVPGSERNIKITRPEDLILGGQIARSLRE